MEIENKIAEEFCRNVRRFGRDNGLSGKQMMKMLKMVWENYERDESDVESFPSSLIEFHDGIDGSLKDGEWTPATDLAISLMVGTYPIISCF